MAPRPRSILHLSIRRGLGRGRSGRRIPGPLGRPSRVEIAIHQVREVRFVKQETLRRIDATLSYVESDGTRSLRVVKQGS